MVGQDLESSLGVTIPGQSRKRQKTQRSYKKRLGTSVEFFCKFVKVCEDERTKKLIYDASGILSAECYLAWLAGRKTQPADPQRTFRKTIQAHCRGSDKRRPFPEEIEVSLLSCLRRNDPWYFFEQLPAGHGRGKERRKESGFRKLGYHESRRLKQKQYQEFNGVLSENSFNEINSEENLDYDENYAKDNVVLAPKDEAYCGGLIKHVNRNLDGPNKFEIIDSGFRKVSIDLFLSSLDDETTGISFASAANAFLDDLTDTSFSSPCKMWPTQSRSILESFGNVTSEELEQVLSLKAQTLSAFERVYGCDIPDSVGGDVRLLRYIRKSKGDVATAVKSVEAMLQWRQDNKVDEVRKQLIHDNESIESLLAGMVSTRTRGLFPFFSLDKIGDIVDIWVFGDEYEEPNIMSVEEFVAEHIRLAEFRAILLDRLSRSQKRMVRFLWLLDVRTTSFRQRTWLPYWSQVCFIDQNFYPEQNSNILVVGCSRFTKFVWGCISPLVHENTKRDIFIFDAASLKDATIIDNVPDILSPESAPQFLGGVVQSQLGVGTARQKLSAFV